jgi:hypothetical protein
MEIKLPIGGRIQLPGHFDAPVIYENAPPFPNAFECRLWSSDGMLEEAIIPEDEAAAPSDHGQTESTKVILADAQQLRSLLDSARIRLAYAHDRLHKRPASLLTLKLEY